MFRRSCMSKNKKKRRKWMFEPGGEKAMENGKMSLRRGLFVLRWPK